MEKVIALIILGLLIVSLLKWIYWKLCFQAVLLYYAECGNPLPDKKIIEKYLEKVVMKSLHIRDL